MLLAALLCLILPALALAEVDSRIIGGRNANIANYPFQASLRNGGTHTCGAVLFSASRALTAAHCGGSAVSSYSILAGSSDRTIHTCATCALRNPVNAIVRHPGFANNPAAGYPNDIAVIWFFSIATNGNINYARLADSTSGDFSSAVCQITGWGRLEPGTGPLPNTLQEGAMTVMSNEQCIETWGANRVRPESLCAINSMVAACAGDNGSPLTCNGVVAGISSWGEANCGVQFPSVFIRISLYYDWIMENL
jgi:secreted trypsin-like serine protease